MADNTLSLSYQADLTESRSVLKGAVVLLGRFLFTAIFLISSFGHFSEKTITYAASQGVPFAQIAVPVSGLLALAGGLSLLVGYKAKIGAWLLVLFLVPITFMMHRFWEINDLQVAQMEMIMFMKNISMLGGALLVTQLGAGPASLDARRQR
jgi:putative oxidoreductase